MIHTEKNRTPHRMKVVPHRPYLGFFLLLGVVLLLLVSTSATYFAGRYQLAKRMEEKTRAFQQTEAQLVQLKDENNTLRLRLAAAEQSVTIGEHVGESVREELVQKESEIAELRQKVSFYRGIMAPEDGSGGVSISNFSIFETSGARRYQYKLLVQQSAVRHQLVTGTVNFTVVGKVGGQAQRYTLNDLSSEGNSPLIPLRFKYFQNIEGELQLPEGFEPEGVELSLKSNRRKGFSIDQRYGWLIQKT